MFLKMSVFASGSYCHNVFMGLEGDLSLLVGLSARERTCKRQECCIFLGQVGLVMSVHLSYPCPCLMSLIKSVQKATPGRELSGQEAGFNKDSAPNKKDFSRQEILESETDCNCKMQLPSQRLDETVAKVEGGDMRPDPENPAAEPLGNGENEEGNDCSNVSSEWGSLLLEMEFPRLSQGKASGILSHGHRSFPAIAESIFCVLCNYCFNLFLWHTYILFYTK